MFVRLVALTWFHSLPLCDYCYCYYYTAGTPLWGRSAHRFFCTFLHPNTNMPLILPSYSCQRRYLPSHESHAYATWRCQRLKGETLDVSTWYIPFRQSGAGNRTRFCYTNPRDTQYVTHSVSGNTPPHHHHFWFSNQTPTQKHCFVLPISSFLPVYNSTTHIYPTNRRNYEAVCAQ